MLSAPSWTRCKFKMSNVIEVEDLWKKYRLGVIGTGTLRHDFERWWHRVRGKPDPHAKVREKGKVESQKKKVEESENRRSNGELADDEVWALRGVSFEVKQGEILGIIGRNGAGKSTLLKILSRVTAPTKGEVRVKGRIASLLEVGTGFHPELTGRENIFLNGAILGMNKAEIRSKLDEIVAFAGVETYIDTPVKRYSSGMYVRLAFAVAAHLEPEILIVDEVLAVGDAEFQKKCLGKMEQVSRRQGRTVLFVSHNMAAIQALCEHIIYIDNGRLRGIGSVDDQINLFLEDIRSKSREFETKAVSLGTNLELRRFAVSPTCVCAGEPMDFEIELYSSTFASVRDLVLLIYSAYGTRLSVMDLRNQGQPYQIRGESRVVRGRIQSLPLVDGDYRIGLYVRSEEYHDNLMDLTTVRVRSRASHERSVQYAASHRGLLNLEYVIEK